MTVRYQKCLEWFRRQMDGKLAENVRKPHWNQSSIGFLMAEFENEKRELDHEVWTFEAAGDALMRQQALQRMIREAADVANFCMMVADSARRALGITLDSGAVPDPDDAEILEEANDPKLCAQIRSARADYKRTGGVPVAGRGRGK